jgi:two-component system LytT family response regulator
MPGQSGFEFLKQVQRPFRTICVTAHDQFALRAFEVNGLDYLMKPIARGRLARAIHRLMLTPEPQGQNSRLRESDYLFVSSPREARFIQVRKIQYIVAAGAYSEIVTANEGKWMMLRSMKEWQERLPSERFVRIHRSALVNLDFVDRLEPMANHSSKVLLRDVKATLWMSRRCALILKKQDRSDGGPPISIMRRRQCGE